MNRPEGYWILDLSGEGVSQAQTAACPEAGSVDLLLMTDGFSRLVEVYGVYDWDGLMNRALQAGLAACTTNCGRSKLTTRTASAISASRGEMARPPFSSRGRSPHR